MGQLRWNKWALDLPSKPAKRELGLGWSDRQIGRWGQVYWYSGPWTYWLNCKGWTSWTGKPWTDGDRYCWALDLPSKLTRRGQLACQPFNEQADGDKYSWALDLPSKLASRGPARLVSPWTNRQMGTATDGPRTYPVNSREGGRQGWSAPGRTSRWGWLLLGPGPTQ
jgi:hypothetical protein